MSVSRVNYHVVITVFLISLITGVFTNCVPMQNCYPPHCRCNERRPPTNEPINNIPQIVLFTFDDAVREQDLQWYKSLFSPKRKNPNGCPICMTLFLQDKYTDYKAVRELYHYGMEIAVHSVSHRVPSSFWQSISRQDFESEACQQKRNIHEKAGVPLANIRGWRSPFLQPSGETQYSVLQSCNFTYDSTLTISKRSLLSDSPWPFTLDFGWPLPCGVPPCPTSSYPGFWILPVVSLITSQRTPAVYVDAFRPNSVKESYEFLWSNFQSYYNKRRPPFMLNMHSAWFSFPYNLQAMDQFIQKLISLPDVYIITSQQALDWLENPVSLSRLDELPSWGCPDLNPVPRVTPVIATPTTPYFSQALTTTTESMPSDKVISTSTAVPSTTVHAPSTSSVATTYSLPTVPTTSPDFWSKLTSKERPVQTVTFKLPLYTGKLYTTTSKPLVTSTLTLPEISTSKLTSPVPSISSTKRKVPSEPITSSHLLTVTFKLPISTPSYSITMPKQTTFTTSHGSPLSSTSVPTSRRSTQSSTILTTSQTTILYPTSVPTSETTTQLSTRVPQPSTSPQFTVNSTLLPEFSTLNTTFTTGILTMTSYETPSQTDTTLTSASEPHTTLGQTSTMLPQTTSQISSDSYSSTTTTPIRTTTSGLTMTSSTGITTTSGTSTFVTDANLSTTIRGIPSTSSPIQKATMPSDTTISTKTSTRLISTPLTTGTVPSAVPTQFFPEKTTRLPILLTKIIHHEEDKPSTVPQEYSGQDKSVQFISVQICVLSSVLVLLL